ncbi:helix-turn-helix domain-containing protein [Aerococcus tenax]|uniref:helix-turn-helix domain-containing protein n=1 Tax=Aerococcus tenax TaxID=3078812 RepID=UPI0018A742D7|nr:helix-turn-helix transcriptional regulator [Aerococcus tenax]
MTINKHELGQKIKKIRVEHKLTLAQFADEIKKKTEGASKTGKSNVSKWERGENVPNDITIKAIADIGGITVDELLHGNQKDRLYNLLCSAMDENSEVYSEDLVKSVTKYLDTYDNLSDTIVSINDPEKSADYEDQSIRNFFRTNLNGFMKYNSSLDFNQPSQIIDLFIQYINTISREANKTYSGASAVIMNAVDTIDPYSYTTQSIEEYVKDHDKMLMTKEQAIERYFVYQLYKNVIEIVTELNNDYWTYKTNEENKEE